jgi:hypothetical protein
VSTPDKADPARGWMYLMNLLAEDERERLEKMSDEEFEREMRAKGRDPARVPSVEQLLAKAATRAGRRVAAIASETKGIRVDNGARPTPQERAETSRDEAERTDAERDKKTPGQ